MYLTSNPQKTKAPKAKAAPKATAKKTAAPKAATKKAIQTTVKPKVKAVGTKRKAKVDTEDEDSAPEAGSLHDDSLLSATPPSAKKQKKAPAPKKTAGKPLQTLENEAGSYEGVAEPKAKKGGSSEQYQKVRIS